MGILIGSAIAIILPIILIQIFGYGEDTTEEVADTAEDNNPNAIILDDNLETTVFSPIKGTVLPLSEVNDPIFAQEMMGKGLAIQPSENTVVSPIEGVVSMIAPSKHAIGITSTTGVEILIHVGLDTVQLNGEGFELLVQEHEKIDRNQPLLNFNKEQLEQQGYDTVIPIIITNSGEFEEVIVNAEASVTHEDKLMTVISK